jgi:hypothetical protein
MTVLEAVCDTDCPEEERKYPQITQITQIKNKSDLRDDRPGSSV